MSWRARREAGVILALLALVPGPAALAAFERAALSPEAEAMGGVLAAGPDGVWGNPAGAALPERAAGRRFEAAAARPFDLAELSESQMGALLVHPEGAIGLGMRRFGSQLYAEKELRLTGAWSPTPSLALGAASRALSAGGAFAPVRSFALDVALVVRADPSTDVGAVVEAVLGEVPGDPRAEGRRTAFGVARRLGPRAALRVELQRHGAGPLAAALGASWTPWPVLTLRAGAREDPRTLSWGFTVRYGAMAVSGSSAHAEPLGRTVRIGLQASR